MLVSRRSCIEHMLCYYPWIFSQIKTWQETGIYPDRPSLEEVVETILRHAKMQIEFKGEYTGIREMRKHASWYMSGYKNSSKLRGRINEIESIRQMEELFKEVLDYQAGEEVGIKSVSFIVHGINAYGYLKG